MTTNKIQQIIFLLNEILKEVSNYFVYNWLHQHL